VNTAGLRDRPAGPGRAGPAG